MIHDKLISAGCTEIICKQTVVFKVTQEPGSKLSNDPRYFSLFNIAIILQAVAFML